MLQHFRLTLLAAFPLAMLSACDVSSSGSESGTIRPPAQGTPSSGGGGTGPTGGFNGGAANTGTHDTVVSTPSVAGTVSVVVGASQTVSVTFNSSDGRLMSGFAISNSLGQSLPAGWTGPANFGCAMLSTGSGCVLNLKYSPTAYNSGGTLTLNYVFIDNSMSPVTQGSTSFNFKATTDDNVIAAAAPMGQINATIGAGTQTVTETFTTDDGFPASAFNVTTDLTALPAGWSAPAALTCATVSAGTPCQLPLTYMPAAPGSGTLTINYAFIDDSGTAKTAALNIPYAATSDNVVVNTPSPAGTINVASGMGAAQIVTVDFTTDDGFAASNLILDLTSLPATWTAAPAQFACATVSAGTPCQLVLTYAPSAPGESGTLQLPCVYFDNAGTQKTATVNISYSST